MSKVPRDFRFGKTFVVSTVCGMTFSHSLLSCVVTLWRLNPNINGANKGLQK